MAALTTTRQERGQAIAELDNQIKRIDAKTYEVKSQNGNGVYEVLNSSIGWMCQCPDHIYRGVTCKHIHAALISQAIRAEVAINKVIPKIDVKACQYCGSTEIVKDGVRHNKHGDLQIYNCKNCGHYFTINLGFKRMRATPQAITTAMQLYFTGESLRNVQKFLKLQGVKVSHVAILEWIRKYTKLMKAYVEKIVPKVSDTWRADEIRFKVRGNMKYLFAVMDDETRFWIAQEVADTKHSHDCFNLFEQSKVLMGKQPKTIITDGLNSYSVASEVVLDEAKHIRHIRLQGDVHNNKMERLNDKIRDREKTMRGLKTKNTEILKGMQIYHNFIREHEGLNGKTPAEACGIKIEGKNKWKTLIQNASKQSH